MQKRFERPILYATDMVRAIEDERKTITRRMVGLNEINAHPDWYWLSSENYIDKKGRFCQKLFSAKGNKIVTCPYGAPGDFLWVRETFYQYGHWSRNGLTKTSRQKWQFVPYDNDLRFHFNPPEFFEVSRDKETPHAPRWYKRLGRFMPKSAARIWLEITDIRVERMKSITEEDAIAEGIEATFSLTRSPATAYKNYYPKNNGGADFTRAKWSFESLWVSINGFDSWKLNPWVWVVSFKVLSTTGRPAEDLPLSSDLLNNRGNIDDIRNSIRCSWNMITTADLQASIDDELKTRKRSTVIKLLESSLKKKRKSQLTES